MPVPTVESINGALSFTTTPVMPDYCNFEMNGACYVGGHNDGLTQDFQMSYPENMIFVQVNVGETFSIKDEDGSYRSISGPALVPVASQNGAIPPIYVPPGYVTKIVEEHGIRHVLVLPSGAPGTLDGQSFIGTSSMHSHHHLPMQSVQQAHFRHGGLPHNMFPSCLPDSFQMTHRPVLYSSEEVCSADYPSSVSSIRSNSVRSTPPPDMHSSSSPRSHYPTIQERSPKRVRENQSSSGYVSNESSQDASSATSSPVPPSSYQSSPGESPKTTRNLSKSNGHRKRIKSSLAVTSELLSQKAANGQIHVVGVPKKDWDITGNQQSSKAHHASSCSVAASKYENVTDSKADQTSDSKVSSEADCFQTMEELLATIRKPEVYDIKPRSAVVEWEGLPTHRASPELQQRVSKITILFILQISNHKTGRFDCAYRGKEEKFTLPDLKPASEYRIRLQATCDHEIGPESQITIFRTLRCAPDAPLAPKLQSRTKNSLQLKWTVPNENGENILKYYLELNDCDDGDSFRPIYSNFHKQFKVTKLVPSRFYMFRLAAENRLGKSLWSPTVSFQTSGTAPGTPDAPQLAKATVRSLSLAWAAPSGNVSSYILEMNDETTGYGFRPYYNGPDLKCTVKDLVRSSNYKFRLQAYNNDGKSRYSEVASFLTCPDRPQPPRKPQVKGNPHARFFTIAWDEPRDTGGVPVNEYLVEITAGKDNFATSSTLSTGVDTECLINDLEPGHEYQLRAFCLTRGGKSLPSDVISVTTPPVKPGPCQTPMLAMRPKPTCLSIKWEAPYNTGGSSITQYELNYSCATAVDSVASEAYKGPDLERTIGCLRPNTKYSFSVRASNRVGSGPWSERMEAITSPGAPEKPQTPEATALSPTSVHLQWNAPENNGADITSYRLQWGGEECPMSVHMTGPVLVHQLQHLKPNKSYLYCLQALNNVGSSPSSDVGCVVTPPSCPDPVSGLRLGYVVDNDVTMSLTSTQIPIQWDKPNDNGAEIISYKVRLQQCPSGNQEKHDALLSEIFEVDGSLNCFCVEPLEADTLYSVKVCASNSIGCGSFSTPIQVRTKPLPPDAPVLKCVQAHPNHLSLQWTSQCRAGSGTQYLLQMRDKRGRFITCYRGSNLSYGVTKLSENTTYKFRVNASNSEGVGPFSKEYAFATAISLPPTLEAPSVRDVRSSSCKVSWLKIDHMRGDPIRYRLSLQKVDDSNYELDFSCKFSNCQLEFLAPNTQYRLRVAAVRRISSARWQHRDDSSTSSEMNDDDHESELPGHFSSTVTFSTLVDEFEAGDDMEVPRLTVLSEPAVVGDSRSSKNAAIEESVSKVVDLHHENSNGTTVSNSMSDERKTFILLLAYVISGVLFAFLLQIYCMW